jgi:cellulose synthase operon protein B
VTLKEFKVKDSILLPTTSSKYEIEFTRPKTWALSGKSTINLAFQHSIALLPHRSRIKVMVNDSLIHNVPLTRENNEYDKLSIPLPVGLLKEFNKLTLEVEQHYTDKCEDPLDKALWTQILPESSLFFDYTPVIPSVDLTAYPYPIIDTLTYSPSKVHYVIAQNPSEEELKALAYVNVHLGQSAQKHAVTTRVSYNTVSGADDEHLVFIGSPAGLGVLQGFSSQFSGFRLQGGQWIDAKTGSALPSDAGLILFFQPAGAKEKTALVVTGNSPRGIMQAAQYLTTRPHPPEMAGQSIVVPAGWPPSANHTAKVSRFVAYDNRSFMEMGFKTEEVHKITAQPIIYKVPVVTDFYNGHAGLWLDLSYSYSKELNPEFSSLELRLNNISVANIPLTNPNGETLAKATVPLAAELLRPRNELVAQFHLMPDKQGWCVEHAVDNAWGKILDDSAFRIEGHPKSYLPDAGLLNNTMYPYSSSDNLETVQIILPDAPTLDTIRAMLAFTTRLGRATLADTDLRLQLGVGANASVQANHVAIFKHSGNAVALPAGNQLSWLTDGTAGFPKALALAGLPGTQAKAQVVDAGTGTIIEQYSPSVDKVITVFTASQAKGFEQLATWFENDKQFEKLDRGFLQQSSLMATLEDTGFNRLNQQVFHQERAEAKQPTGWWQGVFSWLPNWLVAPFSWILGLPWLWIAGGFVAFLFFIGLIRVLLGVFKR